MSSKKPKSRPKLGRPKLGRPTKLTADMAAAVVESISIGNYISVAAHLNGLSSQTVFGWLKRGSKEKKGIYRDFLDAVKQAQARVEQRLILRIDEASKKDWKASAWRLEHMFPKRYRDKRHLEITGKGGASMVPQAVIYLPDNGRLPNPDDSAQ